LRFTGTIKRFPGKDKSMLFNWYRRWIGRYIFRKLNLGIGILLLTVFVMLGFLTYNSFYKLLEEREQDLLNIRTENMRAEVNTIITQLKQETFSLYPINGEVQGTYSYFIPGNIPSSNDPQQMQAERNYFNALLSYMLQRNPQALSMIMYRNADRSLFTKARGPSAVFDKEFDYASFFASLPADYEFPYIGKLQGIFSNIDRPLIYFINPIFEYNNIRYDNVNGYFMLLVDSKTLIDMFHSENNGDERLLIGKSDQVLLDSLNSWKLIGKDILSKKITMKNYGLDITGMTSKASIQAKLSQISLLLIIVLLCTWIGSIGLIHYFLKFVIRRLKLMTRHFKKVQMNPFTEPMTVTGGDEIADLIDRFNRMTSQLQEHINRVYISDIQKSNAEYLALKMQINPHFLYNTLESLRMQAVINKQPVIADKLYYLGKLYRWILKTEEDEIPIEEELQYTRYYLDLFMMGKSRQIGLETEAELDLNELYIPKFSLQPIVENAILHGELEKVQEPLIRLKIRIEGDFQIIEIINNGKGMEMAEQLRINDQLHSFKVFQKEHLGLKNIHERIRAFYGESYGLFVLPTKPEEGFAVYMKLPKEKKTSWEEPSYAKIADRG
jgi:two-component system sensor histidine kinase YesM